MKTYQEIQKREVEGQEGCFLVVTATDVETKAFHEVMPDTIQKVVLDDHTYYLGEVGHYPVINVQCRQMGSLNPGGSQQTINAAFNN